MISERVTKQRDEKSIHTIIDNDDYKKLLEYGKGYLKTGITNLLHIAESREIIITIKTEIRLNDETVN